jgi:hypothetical protein
VDAVFKGNVTSGQGSSTQPSEFAFVVSNQSTTAAVVTISRYYGSTLQNLPTVNVPASTDPTTHGLATIRVPWQSIGTTSDNNTVSGKARYGYRLQSTRPLTVYQFNPIGASVVDPASSCSFDFDCQTLTNPGGTCTSNGKCNIFAYSNDASLLLPAHILGTSYVAMSADHIVDRSSSPSSAAAPTPFANAVITIVATQDNTMVTVRPAARTVPSRAATSPARLSDQTSRSRCSAAARARSLALATRRATTSRSRCSHS